MKKLILIIGFILTLLLTGCGKSDLSVYDIKYKDKVLTYNTDNVDDVFFDNGIELDVNSNNIVRKITITTPDVKTYNGITVGDKMAKVESKNKFVFANSKNTVVVIIDPNGKEINAEKTKAEDSFMCYYYQGKNGIIETIYIMDVLKSNKNR